MRSLADHPAANTESVTVGIARAGIRAELDAIRGLFVQYECSLDFSLCFQGFDEELAGLPGAYAPPRGCLLWAHTPGAAAGCVALRALEPSVCEMKRLYVRPGYRGAGVGRRLVAALIEQACALGYERMRLDTVASMIAARSLYADLGFRPIDAYCENPIPGTVWMERDLRQPAVGSAASAARPTPR